MRPSLLVPALLYGLAAHAAAQDPTPWITKAPVPEGPGDLGMVPTRVELGRTAGLHRLDDVLLGVGDGYRVRFDEAGVEFVPALELAPSHEFATTLRLDSIRRGEQVFVPDDAWRAGPTFDGLRVEYDRGPAIERYDVGVDGIEQSFVFRERPAGTGDLVVSLRLATELQVRPFADGLRLERPGLGGFDIGGVVGIDGAGRRCAGTVRSVAGRLELALPAAFVEHAALPLTLDPFIGNVFRLASTALDHRPRISYDLTSDSYLVVWQSSNAVHGHRVSRAGALVGTRFVIATTGQNGEVADIDDRNVFIVVYERSGDIFVRLVSGTGSVAAETNLTASDPDPMETPTIGGSLGTATGVPGAALCAWRNRAELRLEIVSLTVDPSQRPSLIRGPLHVVIEAAGQPLAPRLSRNDGAVGRWALVYHQEEVPLDRVHVRVLDGTARSLAVGPTLGLAESTDANFADVDGDGTNWVVAWKQLDPFLGAGVKVRARGVAWSASQRRLFGVGSEERLGRTDGLSASVTRLGESVLLGNVINTGASVQSIDPYLCAFCEPSSPFVGVGGAGSTPFGCGTISGGGPPDDALFAGSDVNGVFAQPFRAADGSVTVLGGGCGEGGQALATCPHSPNGQFAHRLRNARPNRPSAFVISGLAGQFGCGGCNLIPDLAAAIAISTNNNNDGDSTVRFSIPSNSSLRGVPLFEQWVTIELATPACSLLSLDFSDALRVVIE